MSSKWVRDYLTFTKKERLAIGLLIALILGVYFLPGFLSYHRAGYSINDGVRFDSMTALINERDSADMTPSPIRPYAPEKNKPSTVQLFSLDPNTASIEDWYRMGINGKTAQTIQHYIKKGGQFKRPEDLKKIYGLKEDDYKRLQSYIRITTTPIPLHKHDSIKRSNYETATYGQRRKKEYFLVDVNLADSALLSELPGIGIRLASRIVHFRDRLGGFYNIDQLGETYGLPDSTFQRIKPFLVLGLKPLVKININQADISRLNQHPYISWTMAKVLLQYRAEHGPFSSVEEISKISAIPADQLKRLIPYLSTY